MKIPLRCGDGGFCQFPLCTRQMTCERTDLPTSLRAQSLAELLPDVVLSCTGGQPASAE